MTSDELNMALILQKRETRELNVQLENSIAERVFYQAEKYYAFVRWTRETIGTEQYVLPHYLTFATYEEAIVYLHAHLKELETRK